MTVGLTRGVSSEVEGQEERERELKTKIEAEKARCVSWPLVPRSPDSCSTGSGLCTRDCVE